MKSIAKIGGVFLVSAIFLASTIVAIIFAQGSTLRQDGTITQTSIVLIDTIPADVSVSLDEKEVSLSDRKIEWVEPGVRNLKLSKAGYKDWQKNVLVQAGIVKEIYAQLFPNEVETNALTKTAIDKVVYSDNSEFAYFTVLNSADTTKNGLWRLKLTPNFLDLGSNTPILISSLNTQLESLKANEYNLILSPDNNRILLQIPETKVLLMLETNRQDQSSDVVNLLGFYPDSVSWFRGSDSLIVEKSNLLFEYELSSGQKSLVDFSFDNELIYSVNTNYVMYLNSQNKKLFIYSNKLSVPVEDQMLDIDLSNLVDFYTVRGSQDIVILQFADHMTYINLEKDFEEDILNVQSFKSMSDDGSVIIFSRANVLMSYILKPTPDKKSFDSEEHVVDVDPAIVSSVYFTPLNRSMIFLVGGPSTDVSLIAFDTDGANKTEVLKSASILTQDGFIVSNDSTKLFIPMSEANAEGGTLNNLFEVKLTAN